MPDESGGDKPAGNTEENIRLEEKIPMGDKGGTTPGEEANSTRGILKEVHWIHVATLISQLILAIIESSPLLKPQNLKRFWRRV
ncbi:MAG: hypothetical protein ACYCPD_13410 [Acidobacteriaceae bacterium]